MMVICETLGARLRAASISAVRRKSISVAAKAIPSSLEAEERPRGDAEIINALRDAIQRPLWTRQVADELAVFLSAAKPKAYHISEALKIHRNVNVALDFFAWAKHQPWYTPNPYVYTILINSLGRSSDLRPVQALLRSMNAEGCAVTTFAYNSIIKVFGKAKQFDEVSRFYAEMQESGCKPDSFTFSTLITVYYNAGLLEKVLDSYDQMVKAELPSNDLILEMVIPSLAKLGKLDRACKVFEEMLEKGFRPNAALYFAIVISLAKAGKLDLGMKFYGSMRSAGHKPGLGTFCALIESYARSGRLELAMRFYEDMQAADFKPNLSLYSTLIELHARTGNLDAAMEFYSEMRAVGLSPPLHVYAAMVEFTARGGRPDVAIQLYKDLRDVGLRPGRDTVKQVIAAVGRSGSRKNAENILLEMKRSALAVEKILMEVLMGWLDEGNVGLCGRLFLQARALRIQPDIRACRHLLHGLLEEKIYGAANRVLLSMRDSAGGVDLRSYCIVFKHFVKCSEEHRETPLLDLMRETRHPAHVFLRELLENSRQERSLLEFVSSFYDRLATNSDLKTKRYFTNLLMNYLVLMRHQNLASCVWKVALGAQIYPDAIQFKTDLVWSLYVKNMSVGTALIATLCSLEFFRERILKRRFVPQRIKILTGLRDDASSAFSRAAVEKILGPLDSPFRFNDAPLGCLWCRGASFVKWFRLPYVRELLRAKGTLQRPVALRRF